MLDFDSARDDGTFFDPDAITNSLNEAFFSFQENIRFVSTGIVLLTSVFPCLLGFVILA